MRRHPHLLLLVFLALLCGCGGDGAATGGDGRQVTPPPTPPPPLNVQGNWQFTIPVGGEFDPDITIAGSIIQSGDSLTGAVHLGGSDCFDHARTVNITGTINDPNVSFTLAESDGHTVAVKGSVANNELTGTYSIEGSCVGGKQGAITGFKIRAFAGAWRANYGQGFSGSATINQGPASPEGSFEITGTIPDFQCFSGPVVSGTIVPGIFPSPSHILGQSVLMRVEMDDGGTVNIEALTSQDGRMIGGWYHYVGGTCDGDASGICFGQNFCLNPNDF
jgi:hypothetical protein